MTGINFDLRVIEHWRKHHELLPVVESLSQGILEELADAMPLGSDPDLVQAIEDALYRSGGRMGVNP